MEERSSAKLSYAEVVSQNNLWDLLKWTLQAETTNDAQQIQNGDIQKMMFRQPGKVEQDPTSPF